MDKERLRSLIDLAVTEKFRLSDALAKVFPGIESSKALADMTKLRNRLNAASHGDADHLPLHLRFHVDSKKKSPPDQRLCWFTGPDVAVQRVMQFSEEITADIAGRPLNRSKGISTSTSAMESGKRVVRIFVSYDHDDRPLVESLVRQLESKFGASRSYEVSFWIDRKIRMGLDWLQTIQKSIVDCDFGLFMVSPNFLGSTFIRENEIPPFIGPAAVKPVLPVALVPVVFEKDDTLGIEAHQWFFRSGKQKEGRSFEKMRSSADKSDFAHHLRLEIEHRLDAHFGPTKNNLSADCLENRSDASRTPEGFPVNSRGRSSPPVDADSSPTLEGLPDAPSNTEPEEEPTVFIPEETQHFQRPKGNRFNLSDREALDPHKLREAESRDAIDELTTWATDPDGSPFFALLGETGIGKTTTLKQLTRHLLDLRKHNPKVPLPIFIDLRDYVADQPGQVPTIDQLLTSVIERGWRLTHRSVTAQDILRLVRQEGALILFDGLDEKIVHLTQDRGRDFIRTLWSVLPEAMLRKEQPTPGQGRLLISCRSHYFRDVWSQNAMLTGQDREGIDRRHYPAFCLLPFTDEQIRQYFALHLGNEERAAEAMTLIGRVHNLTDLATRPYLLQLISSRLADLEALALEGKPINAATLYDLVIRSWLNRDDGKHQINASHKRRLMEELAAALWRSGEKQWDADRLEDWLDDFLYANPKLADGYRNKDRDVLKEDLRTATFVLRPDGEAKHFRFAHTSLQEYFLACYLVRTLKDEATASAAWDMPIVTVETLDFMGQLLALDSQVKKALTTMEKLMGETVLRAACLGFAYWMQAIQKNYPEPAPGHVCLEEATDEDLTTSPILRIRGRSATNPLNLCGASFVGAGLLRLEARWIDLTSADLTGLEIQGAILEDVCLDLAQMKDANLTGSIGRGISIDGADLSDANLSDCNWMAECLASAHLPSRWQSHLVSNPDAKLKLSDRITSRRAKSACPFADQSISPSRLRNAERDSRPKALIGSFRPREGCTRAVYSCAWNPDSSEIMSASDDGTLKIWDAHTGCCMITCKGHTSFVRDGSWSPDGSRLLSASGDKTLKVWDSDTGRCLHTCRAHSSFVVGSAWSPDGRHILSCSADNTLRVWDSSTYECMHTCEGHTGSVYNCGWNPAGTRLLSCSHDNTLVTWDARTGQRLQTFTDHSDIVFGCAWSPDGTRLISGSQDGTIKVRDARTGHCLLTCPSGPGGVLTCAWSPDGTCFASGSYNGTVKVWDGRTGECLLTYVGHTSWVYRCTWSPTSHEILSASHDGTIKLWDAQTGECLRTHVHLPNHEWAVIEGHDKRPLAVSKGAWPYLAWQVRDTPDGEPYLLPSEAFGPLPEVD